MLEHNGRQSRVAVCEDERIVALDIKALLKRNDYDVVGLYTAAEDLLADVPTLLPDLVLMDVHLQGDMNGIDAAAILFQRWAIPVIMLTAYGDDPTLERAKMTHPYAYILKPYDERELKIAINIGLFRASMEKRLRASEERYRALFEDSITAIFLVRSDGSVLEANRAFHALAPGVSSLAQFLTEDDEREAVLNDILSGRRVGPQEVRIERGDGKPAWAYISSAPMMLPDGQAVSQCQAVDITERKLLVDRLAMVQKMEAVGRLAGGVAHDFNNVLTAILGYSRLMRGEFDADGRGYSELDGIEQAARRAAGLTRQLLAFARTDNSGSDVVSIGQLVKDLEGMLGRLLGDDVTLALKLNECIDVARIGKTRLEQIVVNLVVNARDAMPDGGAITATSGVVSLKEEKPGALGPVPAGTWAYLEVRDEGTGIAPADLPRIFEPFFTTKAPDKGTGLGLATVAGIVRQAEGHITVASRVGEGTAITVYLPPAGEPERAGCLAAAEESAGPAHRDLAARNEETVLVVEYDDSVRAIIETILDKAGYRVISAGHPGAALLMAENAGPRLSLLVADSVMPLMRGRELARRIRAMVPGLPALYLSSIDAANPVEVDGVYEAYLMKPFGEYELLKALWSLLERSASLVG